MGNWFLAIWAVALVFYLYLCNGNGPMAQYVQLHYFLWKLNGSKVTDLFKF